MSAAPQLAIIADDLTGGLDTGVAFAARGWRTVLRFAAGDRRQATGDSQGGCVGSAVADSGGGVSASADTVACRLSLAACTVWDTETRHADEASAARVVRAVCEDPTVRGAERVYKKIDSTLRGPWLSELRQAWKARAPLTTLLCPAFPAVGRTLVDGELLVHGRPLVEAGFGDAGRLREFLIQRWCGRVVSLSAAQSREAPLFDPDREPWLLLADAETDADLDALVSRLHALDQDRLLCGAGGLAAAWARVLIPEPRSLPPLPPVAGPMWVIAGSQHLATRDQMAALAAAPDCHVTWIEANARDAAARLRHLPDCSTHGFAITVPASEGETNPDPAAIDRAWAADFVADLAAIARERGVAAFAATGGETAALLLQAMGAAALEIDRELLPGIPLCRIADGDWAGTPLVTKAGGFGEGNGLVRAVAFIRRGGADGQE